MKGKQASPSVDAHVNLVRILILTQWIWRGPESLHVLPFLGEIHSPGSHSVWPVAWGLKKPAVSEPTHLSVVPLCFHVTTYGVLCGGRKPQATLLDL